MVKFIDRMFPKESPLDLMILHGEKIEEAVRFLKPAFDKFFDGVPPLDYSEKVDKLEKEADNIKYRIREVYSKLKYTYFGKSDIFMIVHEMDKIIDTIDDILKLLLMNRVENLDDLKELLEELTENVVLTVEEMVDALKELKLVVESDFAPKEIEKEKAEAEEVEKEETKTDVNTVTLGKYLFSKKYEINPVDLIFFMELSKLLSKIANYAENVVERISLIIR